MRRTPVILVSLVVVLVTFVAWDTLHGGPRAAAGEPAAGTGGAAGSPAAPSPAAAAARPPANAARNVLAASLPRLKLRLVATGLDQPLYATSPPGDRHRLFVVEKTGRIRVIQNGKLLATPLLDLRASVTGGSEQGLLSLAFDPRYASNRRFYVYYTDRAGTIRVVRYLTSATNPDRVALRSSKLLLSIAKQFTNHNGGQLQFGPDGLLYIGVGDGGSEGDPFGNGQNPHTLFGKILRMDVNVSHPRATIYALGLRNPWRFSFDRSTHDLWIGDVGQNKWEEIDMLRAGRKAGANLGWNGFEGTHVYKASVAARLNGSRLVWPVAQYSHALGDAVIGGYVYRGAAIPGLRGFYLFADFGSGRVWAMHGPAGSVKTVAGLSGKVTNPSSFGQDAAGELYMTSLTTGRLYEIVAG
jgi:glucose/arabinose dehydrogenase